MSHPTRPGKARRLLLALMALLLAGGLLFPVIAYVAGKRIVGPYDGGRGLGAYLGNIYGGAAAGEWQALLLLTAPLLIAGLWYGLFRLNRATRSQGMDRQP